MRAKFLAPSRNLPAPRNHMQSSLCVGIFHGFHLSLKMLHDPPKFKASGLIYLLFFTDAGTKAEEGFVWCPRSEYKLVVGRNLDHYLQTLDPILLPPHFLFVLALGLELEWYIWWRFKDRGGPRNTVHWYHWSVISDHVSSLSPHSFEGFTLHWNSVLLFNLITPGIITLFDLPEDTVILRLWESAAAEKWLWTVG